ncbi:MAG: pentapeptide repeat-containing protein [Candidatus Babeliales bacterium]|jgi:uncharacterized protein YjbI with pentapeptide repeats
MNSLRSPIVLTIALGFGFGCIHTLFGMQDGPKTVQGEATHKSYGANFSRTTLMKWNFVRVDFADANFSRATLILVTFPYTNLANVNFSQATLRRVNFDGAILTGANFFQAHLVETDLLAAADLHGVNLYGVRGLSNKQLAQALARGAILRLPGRIGSEIVLEIINNLLEN